MLSVNFSINVTTVSDSVSSCNILRHFKMSPTAEVQILNAVKFKNAYMFKYN